MPGLIREKSHPSPSPCSSSPSSSHSTPFASAMSSRQASQQHSPSLPANSSSAASASGPSPSSSARAKRRSGSEHRRSVMLAAASEQLERSLAENPRFHEAQMRQQQQAQASGMPATMMERSVSLEGYPTYLSSGSGAELASSAAAVVQRRASRRKSSEDREEQRAMTEAHSSGEPSATATASSSSSPLQQRAQGETWEHRRKRTHSAPQTPSAAAAVCQILRQRELQREREAQMHAQHSQVSSSSEGQGQMQRSRSTTSTNAAAAGGTAGAKARVMPGLYRGYSTGSSGNSSSYSSGAETLRLDFLTPHAMTSDVERSSGASSPELGFKFQQQQHRQRASRPAPAAEAEQASGTALGLPLDTSADESEQDGSLSPSSGSAMLPSSSSSPPAAEFYLNPLSFFTLAPVQPLTIDTCQPLLLPPVSLAAPTPSASSDKDSSHLGSATPGPELALPLSAVESATHPAEAGAPATQTKKGKSGKRAAFSFWADEEEVEEMLARRRLRLDLEEAEAEAEHASHAPNPHEQEKELVRRGGVGAYLADDEDEPLSSGFVTPTGAHPPLDQHRHQRSNSSLSLFDAPLHPTEPLFRSRSRTTSLDSHAALLDFNGSFHGDPGDEDPETQLAMAILHMHDRRTALSSAAAHSAIDTVNGVTPLLSTSSSADGALPLAAAGLPERALVAPSILLGSRNGPSAGTGTMLRRTRFAVAHSAHQRHAAQAAAAALAARRNGAGGVRMGGRVRFAETAAMQERRLDKAIKSSAQPWLHRLSRILFFFDDKLDIAEPLGEADEHAEEGAAAPIQSPSSTVKSEMEVSPIAPESRPTSKALQRSTSTPSDLAVETQQIRRRSVERRRRSFTASAVDLGSKQMDLQQQQQQQHRRRSTSRTRKMFGMTSLEAGSGRSPSRERALHDPSTASASPSSYYSSSAPTSRRSSWLSLPSLLSRSSSLISLSGAVRNADAEDEDDEDEEEEAEDETPDERAASHPSSDLYISVTGLPSAWYEDMESSSKWAIDASPTWSFTKDAEDADLHDPQRTRSVSSLPSYPHHSRAAFGALTPSSTTTTGKRHLRSLASSPIPMALLPHGQQPSLDDGVLGFEGSHSWSYLTASAARQSNMYLGRGHGSPQLRQYVPLFPATLSPSVREDVIGY